MPDRAAPATSRPRRLAIFEHEDAEKWKGYTEKLWKEVLGRPGDEWRLYECWNGEFPPPEEAASYDAIILSGSHYSAYEEVPWIQRLKQLLPQYVSAGARMYGTCFGCQVLAEALQGKVGPNPSGRFVLDLERVAVSPDLQQLPELQRVLQQALDTIHMPGPDHSSSSSSTMDAAPQQLATTTCSGTASRDATAELLQQAAVLQQAAKQELAGKATLEQEIEDRLASASLQAVAEVQQPAATASSAHIGGPRGSGSAGGTAATAAAAAEQRCFQLMESHGDQILALPPGAVPLATSATAKHEMWALYPNVLAGQFHPELGAGLALEKIWPALTNSGRLSAEESAAARAALEREQDHAHAMLTVIQHFIDHGLGPWEGGGLSSPSKAGQSSSSANTGGTGATGTTGGDGGTTGAGPGSGDVSGSSSISRPDQKTGAAANSSSTEAAPSTPAAGVSGAGSSPAQGPPSTAAAAAAVGDATAASLPNIRVPARSLAAAQTHSDSPGAHGRSVPRSPGHGVSNASTPTAASARSSVAGSTTAVPFAKLALQRQQEDREERLQQGAQKLVNSVGAAFDLQMDSLAAEVQLLRELNDAAAAEYGQLGDVATALAQFSRDMAKRQSMIRDALTSLPDLDRALTALEGRVAQLDQGSQQLAVQLGVKPVSGSSVVGACLGMLQR